MWTPICLVHRGASPFPVPSAAPPPGYCVGRLPPPNWRGDAVDNPCAMRSTRAQRARQLQYAVLVSLLVTMLCLQPPVAAEPPVSRGMALAYACAACHGPNGRSQGTIPSIDRLPTADFVAALQAFRAETRQGTVMYRIAKGLDDADMTAVAQYFAGQPKP